MGEHNSWTSSLKRQLYENLENLFYGRNSNVNSEEDRGGLAVAELFIKKILLFTLESSVSRTWKERPGVA